MDEVEVIEFLRNAMANVDYLDEGSVTQAMFLIRKINEALPILKTTVKGVDATRRREIAAWLDDF